MGLKPFALAEAGDQLLHQGVLLGGQGGRVLGVHGGEGRIPQRMGRPVDCKGMVLPIHPAHHIPVRHIVFRPAAHQLAFQLELDDADGLMHPGI